MTSRSNIPEAAVEAVASIIYRTSGRRRVMSYEDAKDNCESEAREYLEAAAPHLPTAPDEPDRAELSGIISGAVGGWNPATRAITDVADAVLAAGYRKAIQ